MVPSFFAQAFEVAKKLYQIDDTIHENDALTPQRYIRLAAWPFFPSPAISRKRNCRTCSRS